MKVFKLMLTLFLLCAPFAVSGQKVVDLSFKNLQKLPVSLKLNHELEELILIGNPLKSLPEWLINFPLLKKIVLDKVTTLPVSNSFQLLSKCPGLVTLSWEEGKLVYIPVAVSDFPKLKILNLANNGIVKLPLIKKDNKITQLNLSKNLLDSLGLSILHFKKLRALDLSFNPGINNKNNYHLLENLKHLSALTVQGMRIFPSKLCEVTTLTYLNISKSRISALPDNFKQLKNLESLILYDCKFLDFPKAIENLAWTKTLKKLLIGGEMLKKIPFNIFKLRALLNLTIQNSCMEYFPTSIKRLNITTLILKECSITKEARFFKIVPGILSLKNLSLSKLICQNIQLEGLTNLDSLDISHCQLNELPAVLKKTKWINIKGNAIPNNSLKQFSGKIVGVENYKIINPNKSTKHSETEASFTPYKKTIYTHVGETFSVKNLNFDVPPSAFINKRSTVIDGEVVLAINIITKPQDIALLDKSFIDDRNKVINPTVMVEIKAYEQTGKGENMEKKEVFINQKKPITITLKTNNQNRIKGFEYSTPKRLWISIPVTVETCLKHDKVVPQKSFKSNVHKNLNSYPSPSFTVRNSKVQMRLKRNKRRKTLKFEITPEYGYKENFFQLFGDRIKGYPELKVFKKIKWNYVGDSVENVLEQLYFLSDQAKSEKLERKSTFYFYVLDIKNITIIPHPNKDNYIMRIVQGKDTLQLDVMPNLKRMKARKIQRWHKKKYKKYNKKLQERILYWEKLDSLHLNYFTSFEKKLSKFRMKMIGNQTNVKREAPVSIVGKHEITITMDKTGWYQFGENLIVSNLKTEQLKLKISGRNHHAKYVLIRNPKNNQTYWQNTKKVSFSATGQNYIYSKVGTKIYVGKYTGQQTIQLRKFDTK
jgi:Leucine-rich repeat (LRR) protein